MRHVLVAVSALGVMLGGGVAFAQSGQGGYLGTNPGANAPTTAPTQPIGPGSGQGGYLGSNPGAQSSGSGGTMPNSSGVGQPRNQGDSTYGVPGKVGGDQHR